MSFDYCVMGNPVAHSRSPWIHARFAELTGEAVVYDRLHVELDGFTAAVQAFRDRGGQGCNVTVPFKLEAAALATAHSARAQLAQACNTLKFSPEGIYGDNTDGAGLVQDITQHAGQAIAGHDLLLVGAGGASAGVLGPLIEAGARRIVVANRTVAKAQALVERHAPLAAPRGCVLSACGLDAVPGRFDIVVNASASSLAGASVPVAATVLAEGALAVDMMYGPAAAPFLAWARAHGARARDGLGMLVEQAAESFALWRGVRPPSAQVLAELRAIVDA
ncbi:shikimate dehydrogenase [Pseudorhodoferax sp. Leaf265]|uniref:shikimate dehydrogenase n=1 Tax=Pseudorhodoferax sp. Leaf265 TaxID=1736315 RepID=UPI0006F5362B|nr:shikimate dehydrogenase [Pseudorhodoferax sp. Leaf265]KQP16166.1 shikimate dehydrogenase [Pseudorhodoferax sp. Leaf265]